MNLYLLKQEVDNGYDTFDSCVVAAENEEEAKKTHPSPHVAKDWYDPSSRYYLTSWGWALLPDDVTAVLVGTAASNIEGGTVICASFNAG